MILPLTSYSLILLYKPDFFKYSKSPRVFLVPGIITKSGVLNSVTVSTYLTETSGSIDNASKSVKFDICGNLIIAISILSVIFLLRSTAPSSSSKSNLKYGTTPKQSL